MNKNIEKKIPHKINFVLDQLSNNGFKAYIVGGAIRSLFLGKEINDWDIATDALPEDVMYIFGEKHKTILTGFKHGTITVIIDGEPIEITTFRTDGDYSDNRRPDKVSFTMSLKDDLARRDFTINAMAYNPQVGLIDPFNGIDDLNNKIIRCVGNPNERFKEDALRMMRAIRFSSQLGFDIEQITLNAIHNNRNKINSISYERISSEFNKVVLSDDSETGIIQLYLTGLLENFLPELSNLFMTIQNNPNHEFRSVGIHSMEALKNVSKMTDNLSVRLAALFHDVGKQYCKTTDEDGVDHFYGHEKISADKVQVMLERMKYDNATIKKVRELIYWHGTPIHNTKKSVRRALNKIGEEYFLDLLLLKDADDYAKKQTDEVRNRIEARNDVRKIYQEILDDEECFSMKDLAINGKDLIDMGLPEGKLIGHLLNHLLDIVVNSPEINNKEGLSILAKQCIDGSKDLLWTN